MSYAGQPPPPPYNPRMVQEKPRPVAWLVPLAGLLALVGVFTAWFSPSGTYQGHVVLKAADDLYSWKDGKIGLLAPILLVLVSVGVVGLLTGRTVSRFDRSSKGPVHSAGLSAVIAGLVAGAALAVAWFLVPNQYDNIPSDAGGSWDGAEKLGISMDRGPQLGYWLTVAAAVVAVVGGALILATRSGATAVAPPSGAMRQVPGYPPPGGPGQGYLPPQAGYGTPHAYPPPQSGYGAPQGYPPPTAPGGQQG